jgi:hypothetical protein
MQPTHNLYYAPAQGITSVLPQITNLNWWNWGQTPFEPETQAASIGGVKSPGLITPQEPE